MGGTGGGRDRGWEGQGVGGPPGSPWIWRGTFGGQIQTPNLAHQTYGPPEPPPCTPPIGGAPRHADVGSSVRVPIAIRGLLNLQPWERCARAYHECTRDVQGGEVYKKSGGPAGPSVLGMGFGLWANRANGVPPWGGGGGGLARRTSRPSRPRSRRAGHTPPCGRACADGARHAASHRACCVRPLRSRSARSTVAAVLCSIRRGPPFAPSRVGPCPRASPERGLVVCWGVGGGVCPCHQPPPLWPPFWPPLCRDRPSRAHPILPSTVCLCPSFGAWSSLAPRG